MVALDRGCRRYPGQEGVKVIHTQGSKGPASAGDTAAGPTLRLDGLRPLHQSMRHEQVDRVAFSYRNNKARLEIVFLIDEEPFALLIGVRSSAPYSFELPVLPGYRVPMLFNQHLKPLMDGLGVESNPQSPFSTKDFLLDLNAHVPPAVKSRDLPTDLLASRAAASGVEESDKTYFLGWVAHNDGKSVTDSNLDKTRRLLGSAIADRCERSNISSRWTAAEPDRRPVTEPARG